jgi:hypothetical protein
METTIGKWVIEPWPEYNKWRLIKRNAAGGYSSSPFDTKEAAEAEVARWFAVGTCRECAEGLNDRYMEPYKTQIRERQLCMSCLHWIGYVETRDNPTHLVVGGLHYVIEPDRDTTKGYGTLGHGGARFDIRFFDGREVTTKNLWAQGEVPAHFRDRLVDTAAFVQRGHIAVGNLRPGGGGYIGPGSADGCAEQE